MDRRSPNKVKTNEKNNPKPDINPTKVSLNIVSTQEYTGSNQTVFNGFKCIGGHPGLSGQWERYEL